MKVQEFIQFFNHHSGLSIAWIILLIAVVFTFLRDLVLRVNFISCTKAIHLINRECAIILDLRQQDDFYSSHITGAINFLQSKIKENNIKELEKYKTKPIILVDDNGIQTWKSAYILAKSGFEKVFILKEGIVGWNKENLPLIQNKSRR